MKIIVQHRYDKIELILNHEIETPKQINSFGELLFLKEIVHKIEIKLLGTLEGRYIVHPGIESSRVELFNIFDFNKIKTSIRRNNIINNILNEND